MGRLIDANVLKKELVTAPNGDMWVYKEDIDNAPTVEAIPKAEYKNRLKTDLEAILVELQLEIEEKHREEEFMDDWSSGYNSCLVDGYNSIQQKINVLKGERQ